MSVLKAKRAEAGRYSKLSSSCDVYQMKVGDPYKGLFGQILFLKSYLDDISATEESKGKSQVESALASISMVSRKPNLGVMGRSDAGKSHFINTLLGGTPLPAKLQPTTSVVTIVRHIDDRPSGLKDRVVIFKEMAYLEKLDSLEYCTDEAHVYKSGDYDLLSSEIVHNHFEEHETKAYSCVVYLDSDVLRACNIIDAPGFANTDYQQGESSDTEKAISMLSMVDVLVYMSSVTGCMDSTDISSLRTVFKTLPAPEMKDKELPALSNLFFVTSHAAAHVATNDLEELRKTAAARIHKHFFIKTGEGVLEERSAEYGKDISPETLEKRWYFFWSSTKERRDPLLSGISEYLRTKMPSIIEGNIKEVINDVKISSTENISNFITEAENKLIQYEELLNSYRTNLKPPEMAKKLAEIEAIRSELLPMIKQSNDATNKLVSASIGKNLDIEYIEKIINEKYKDKNEAKDYAYVHIIERIQLGIEKIFTAQTKSIENEISNNLEACTISLSKVETEIKVDIPFDAKGAFTGLGAGAGLAMALGAYASSFGSLGGYIVAAKGVSILSSLGIGFGATAGTSGVMSGIAIIGGPVVLTAILATGLALGIKRLFGDSWQKRLAKQIVSTIEENNVGGVIAKNVNNEFDKLHSNVDKGCNNLKEGYLAHIKRMKDELENPAQSKDELLSHIDELRDYLSFFAAAPWALA